jgi:hypothetical protein
MKRSAFSRSHIWRRPLVWVVLAVAGGAVLAAFAASSAPATSKQASTVSLYPVRVVSSGHDISVSGRIVADGDLSGATVKFFEREVGSSTSTYAGKATVTYEFMEGDHFSAVLPGASHSCMLSAVWDGDDDHLAASTWIFVRVRPQVTLKSKSVGHRRATIRVDVAPEQPFYQLPLQKPPFIADVQCRIHGRWTWFPGEVGVASTDGTSWCGYEFYDVKPGTYLVRGHFGGTSFNAPGNSKPQKVVVQ